MSKKKCDCPETVPVLERRNFAKGRYHDEEGRHCLLGHCENVFPGNICYHGVLINKCGVQVGKLINNEILALEKHNDYVPGASNFNCGSSELVSIPIFNDSPLVPKTILARLWNRVMAKMGYTEGNPEADKLDEPLKIRKS